ncbi:MAG TPA: RNB domain-containing ribonuclease, partial [Terriglobia bacterium]|nr:RNB domain-containing ribonuclease [Terriglobia bacterium]
ALDRIHSWLLGRGEVEAGAVLERAAGPMKARDTAYEILVRTGRIASEADRFLVTAGIEARFPPTVAEAAERVAPFAGSARRMDYRGERAITIDDDDTTEVDDALTVRESGGELIVGVHIANVAAYVEKNDLLDVEAARRLSTIYLPASTVRMFPDRVSTDLASLMAGAARPAFTIEARFDSALNRIGFRAALSEIQVHERLSYDEADRRLAEGEPALSALARLAARLRADRAAVGAVVLRRPELKITVSNDAIHVKRIDPNSASRLLVTEMMIMANALAADLAVASAAPIIFRTQERRELPPGDAPENEVLAFERLRKTFKRSRLSLSPGPHSGLGLTAYTQMSSPIRRFTDLVTQRQISALIEGQPFPYDRDDLVRFLGAAETAEQEIRALEERASHYWLLEYLRRESMNQALSATVLDSGGAIELNDYYLRAKVSGGPFRAGETLQVAIESIDPGAQEVRFKRIG